jgi:NDP-sugar pyrophosphorylase family protein
MKKNTPLFVILAGGQGQRFAPLVTNKTLFPFMNKPLILHQLEQLQRVGVSQVLIATNTDNHPYLTPLKIKGLSIQTKLQPRSLGMANALLHLKDEIKNQPIVIMNAVDIVSNELFTQLLKTISTQKPYGLITGIKTKEYFPGGYLKLKGNQVTQIIEKPTPGKEPSDLVNLVFHYLQRPQEFISILVQHNNNHDDAYEQALSKLMTQHEFGFISYDNYWHKLKYPHFVLDVMELFLKHRLEQKISSSAQISPQATIQGRVFIDQGAKIEAGAIIKGPVYIGPGVVVGNQTLVRQSMIEANSIIGFGTEVARSYVGPKCMLHHNFIGDSVLEAEVNPSYGTVTTNWRLDNKEIELKTMTGKIQTHRQKLGAILAKGVFSGVNCSFMPGVSVGTKTKIYPQTVVHQALPEKTTLKSYQEQKIDQD